MNNCIQVAYPIFIITTMSLWMETSILKKLLHYQYKELLLIKFDFYYLFQDNNYEFMSLSIINPFSIFIVLSAILLENTGSCVIINIAIPFFLKTFIISIIFSILS